MSKIGFQKLQEDIISNGLCTSCGTCVGICPKNSLEFDMDREEPVLTGECNICGICYAACPGADIPLPELDRFLFSRERRVYDEPYGVCSGWYKGYAIDPKIRESAASGGCTTALLVYALEKGLIDGVILAGTNPKYPCRPKPILATTKEEIVAGLQSKYALVPNNISLKEVEHGNLNKVCIVGLPCHIEGIRKMQMYGKPKNLISRIKYTIGLFCGDNRSYKATEHVIKSILNIPLDSIAKYEYRGGPESQDTVITFHDGKTEIIPREIFHQATNITPRERCRECWDFSSELADISVGDIFLPINFIRLPKYTCLITRTKAGNALISGAEKKGYINISPLKKSGFSYNIGLETKKRQVARHLIERGSAGLSCPNYYYDVSYEPPRSADIKSAILEQMKDIPEIIEWVTQNPQIQEVLDGIDPEILSSLKIIRLSNKSSEER